jgi:hypothetical protein
MKLFSPGAIISSATKSPNLSVEMTHNSLMQKVFNQFE